MRNYIKIPVPRYLDQVVSIFNTAISNHPEWDRVTKIKSITFGETSLTLTLDKSNQEPSSEEDQKKIQAILNSLGFVYEYNF